MEKRKKTYAVKVGNVVIGGGNPVVVQTMTKTSTLDVESTVKQIQRIKEVGGKLVRVAVPNLDSVIALKEIKKQVGIPLVADVHFDYRIAVECIKIGVEKIRINPANIKGKEKLAEVCKMAKDYNVAVRIGLNAGSYKKKLKDVKSKLISEVEETLNIFEKFNFKNLVLSAKTTDVVSTVEIYQLLSDKYRYPLHIGITEAGPLFYGSIKSVLGIGILLWEGIGDTIRVSLTSSPEDEVKTGYYILQYLNLAKYGIDLISCPTCGRCETNLLEIVSRFENKIENAKLNFKNLKIAIMGCEVNGPGEASSADVGIAMGKNSGVLFIKGKIVKKVSVENCVEELIDRIKQL